MPALKKTRSPCIGCTIHCRCKRNQAIPGPHLLSCPVGVGKLCFPQSLCRVGPCHINPQQLQFGAGHNFVLPCQHLHPSAIRTNEIILEMITITTIWQNLHNHTLKTLYGHHYNKTIQSTALLFYSMTISIGNLAKQRVWVFPLQFAATCDIPYAVCCNWFILLDKKIMIACITHSYMK